MASEFLKSVDKWRKAHPEKTRYIDEIIQKTDEMEKHDKRSLSPVKLTWKSTNGSIAETFTY
jgi:hypothetical protein